MILDYYLSCKDCDNVYLCFDKEIASKLVLGIVDKIYLREDICEDYEEKV